MIERNMYIEMGKEKGWGRKGREKGRGRWGKEKGRGRKEEEDKEK